MQFLFRVLLAVSLSIFVLYVPAMSSARAGGMSSPEKCNSSTCLAYCQGFCDSIQVRCKKTGSGARECRGRGYRSCMNGCTWEICKLRAKDRPSYQCKRHPDVL